MHFEHASDVANKAIERFVRTRGYGPLTVLFIADHIEQRSINSHHGVFNFHAAGASVVAAEQVASAANKATDDFKSKSSQFVSWIVVHHHGIAPSNILYQGQYVVRGFRVQEQTLHGDMIDIRGYHLVALCCCDTTTARCSGTSTRATTPGP